MPAVTQWYYGISHLFPIETVVLSTENRTKQLIDSDLELFEEVCRLGRKFTDSASLLPFLPEKEFNREVTRFEKAFGRARSQMERIYPLCAAYSEIQDNLPKAIAADIVA